MYVTTNGTLIADADVDIALENHGTVVLLAPKTSAGQTWLNENVAAEPWQMMGGKIAAEPRLCENIVEGAAADGITVGIR
jgi:hypothetical protein